LNHDGLAAVGIDLQPGLGQRQAKAGKAARVAIKH
jgi:hypothetical protein